MLDHVPNIVRSTVLEAQKTALLEELRSKGIRQEAVLRALKSVPRELFLPQALHGKAYTNVSLPIGAGQTISQPYTVAFMTELLSLRKEDFTKEKVLEIGTGSGYQAAILAAMGLQRIYSVERVPELLTEAQERLQRLGMAVNTRLSDGTLGWREEAPFDAIIVTAASPDVPEALAQQLALGGRLVLPVGTKTQQKLYRITRIHEGSEPEAFRAEEFQNFRFVPLVGEQGWREG